MRRTALLFALCALGLPRMAEAAPVVWAVDDGEKIKQDTAPTTPLATGQGNPVWSPGQPIRLFAMKNETVSLQIVVAADATALSGVTVDLESLATATAKIANAPGANDPTVYVGRPIERFVEHFFDITRASAGRNAKESLGWAAGSGPTAGKWTGKLPDALIPVEVAPSWSPYPMNVAPNANGIVWIDVTVDKTQPPGLYKGNVVVKAASTMLATLPVELEVVDVTLADRPVKTMLFYDREELDRRIGAASSDAAEKQLYRLYHRHRLSPMHSALSVADVSRKIEVLDGTFYTAKNGYAGPGEGMGDGVLSLGTYGNFGDPDASTLAVVEGIADLLDGKRLFDQTDAFVYATDEDCQSPRGAKWKSLIAGSSNPRVKKVRVGWTCSEDPVSQPVDIAIQLAAFDPTQAAKARALGKDVWTYNGHMPETGAFMTDTPAISLRVNGWISGMFAIGRWFYWETTFWYDGNRGGLGPYDPFATAETFHNSDGDYCAGDGVLVYPGKQVDMFTAHSIGMDGVIASIRLKNWRRGIQDAGYYQLAHAADAKRAEDIAKGLLPAVLSQSKGGQPPSWSEAGKPFFDARKALLALIAPGTNGGAGPGATPMPGGPGDPNASGSTSSTSDGGCGCRGCVKSRSTAGALGATVLGVGLAVMWRRRRRQRR